MSFLSLALNPGSLIWKQAENQNWTGSLQILWQKRQCKIITKAYEEVIDKMLESTPSGEAATNQNVKSRDEDNIQNKDNVGSNIQDQTKRNEELVGTKNIVIEENISKDSVSKASDLRLTAEGINEAANTPVKSRDSHWFI